MLMNLNKKSWVDGLTLRDYNQHCKYVLIDQHTSNDLKTLMIAVVIV